MALKTSTTGLTSAAAVDAQWLEIEARLAACEGGALIKDEILGWSQDSEDGAILFDLGPTKDPLGPFVFPPAPYKRMGEWAPGIAYLPWDIVTVSGSSFVCNTAHNSSALFKTDLDLQRWQDHALRGKDAYVFRGVWSSGAGWTAGSVTTPFAAGDAVLYNGKVWSLVVTPPTTHTAPGTEAGPGVTASPWLVLMSNFPFSAADVKDATEGKRQNTINAELRAEIAALKTRCQNIENRLAAASIP